MPDPSRLDTVLLPSNSSEPGSTSDCQSVAKKPHKPFMESHEAASQLRGSSRASATSDNDYDMWPSTETLWIIAWLGCCILYRTIMVPVLCMRQSVLVIIGIDEGLFPMTYVWIT